MSTGRAAEPLELSGAAIERMVRFLVETLAGYEKIQLGREEHNEL